VSTVWLCCAVNQACLITCMSTPLFYARIVTPNPALRLPVLHRWRQAHRALPHLPCWILEPRGTHTALQALRLWLHWPSRRLINRAVPCSECLPSWHHPKGRWAARVGALGLRVSAGARDYHGIRPLQDLPGRNICAWRDTGGVHALW
jgi:hypothetical protein